MIRSILLALPIAAFFLTPASGAETAAPAAGAVATAEVHAATPATVSPSTIYTVERLRDPFTPVTGGAPGSVAPTKAFTADDFNIHTLSLRGIMKDQANDYALFSDPTYGVSFILRRGKLYDFKNKLVRGVTGELDVKRKRAQLRTIADGDVQTYRLGEEEKD